MKKKICYVNPTVLLKRPIAELIANLGDSYELGLLIPKRLLPSLMILHITAG